MVAFREYVFEHKVERNMQIEMINLTLNAQRYLENLRISVDL